MNRERRSKAINIMKKYFHAKLKSSHGISLPNNTQIRELVRLATMLPRISTLKRKRNTANIRKNENQPRAKRTKL